MAMTAQSADVFQEGKYQVNAKDAVRMMRTDGLAAVKMEDGRTFTECDQSVDDKALR